jgi:hypothetical protein
MLKPNYDLVVAIKQLLRQNASAGKKSGKLRSFV